MTEETTSLTLKSAYSKKKYINAYENAKKKFLAKDPNNKNLTFKEYQKINEYTEELKIFDNINPDITLYKMIKETGGIDIFRRNRNYIFQL